MGFESEACAVSFKKGRTKDEVLSELSINGILKALLRQSLSDTCSLRKITARHVLSQLLGYQRTVSRYSVSTDADLRINNRNLTNTRDVREKRGAW